MNCKLIGSTTFALLALLTAAVAPARADGGALALKKTDAGFTVTGLGKDAAVFEIDSGKTGFLKSVKIGDKTLVDANAEPPVFATVLESARGDGFADFIPDAKEVPATYHLLQCTAAQKGDDVEVVTTGQLDWSAGDSVTFELHTLLQSTGHVGVTIKADPHGTFKNRSIREIGLRLPLALNERKRVVQAGDRGMRFDTRFEYQYHADTAFLESPDFNFWQHFWIDQASAVDYTMWRAESLAVSGLTEFRGRLAPGWTTAYDQQGGVLLSYKDMPAHAPKALYVNARDHGVAVVYLHAPTHRALDLADKAAAAQVFGLTHQTDWIFFKGEELAVKPDQMLAKIWNTKLASDAPERADDVLNKINLLDSKLTVGSDAPLVAQGVPFPQGTVTALTQLSLSQNKQEVPLQTKTLAYWPDGSIKWAFLVFPLDADKNLTTTGSKGEGDSLPLSITLRTPEKREFVLKYGKNVQAGKVASPLTASIANDVIQINTGPLQLKLGKGERWLSEAILNGRSIVRNDGKAMSSTDFVRTQTYSPNSVNASGDADDGPLVINKIELQESGPLRAIVRLEGMTTSKEPMKVILRLEAYAGRSYVRVTHSVEFLQNDTRIVFLRKMGIHLPLGLEASQAVAIAGGQDGAVALTQANQAERAGLTQNNPLHYSAWRQGTGEHYLTPVSEANRSRGWLDFSDKNGGVAVVIRNMWQEAPSELVAATGINGQGGPVFDINLWPESAPLMDVRRYSNYGHMAQGESAGEEIHDNSFWAEKVYYRTVDHQPFVGVSKTHEMLIYFHDAAATPAAIDSLAADFQSPALVYAGAKWYAETAKVILPTILPGDPHYAMADDNMETGAKFLLFHQKYWNWYGMWDYGDVGHMFKRGYGKTIPEPQIADLLKLTPDARHAEKGKDIEATQDYWPQHDWAFDNGRWGWSNTEALTNFFMQSEYLRTGDRDEYFFSESAAHEARDVVMRHEGTYFGYGTRHGVQHWSDGNHEQRQTINAEFRYNYYISGDLRSAEFAQDLTDNFYMTQPIGPHNDADHNARLYGLLFAWERTHDQKYLTTLTHYIHSMCVPDGFDTYSAITFPDGKRADAAGEGKKKANDGGFFFQYFGSMHALLEYYELTHDEVLRQALLKYAAAAKGDMLGGTKKFPPVLAQAFAARYADNKAVVQQQLADRLVATKEMLGLTFATWPMDPSHWTGLIAPVTHYPSAFFWLNSEGYSVGALPKEPALTPDQMDKLKQRGEYSGQLEKGQPTVQIPVERESWQNEYDNPAIKSYATPKRPLEK